MQCFHEISFNLRPPFQLLTCQLISPACQQKRNNQSRLNQVRVHIKKKYYGLITTPSDEANDQWLTVYSTMRSMTVFTKGRVTWHYVSQMNPVHSLSSYSSVPILMSCQHLVLPNGLFPSGFHTKTLYEFLFSPYMPHAPPISSSSIYFIKNKWFVQNIKFPIT